MKIKVNTFIKTGDQTLLVQSVEVLVGAQQLNLPPNKLFSSEGQFSQTFDLVPELPKELPKTK